MVLNILAFILGVMLIQGFLWLWLGLSAYTHMIFSGLIAGLFMILCLWKIASKIEIRELYFVIGVVIGVVIEVIELLATIAAD